jgi:hypothetical protein
MRIRRRSMLLPDVQKCAEQIASHPLELKRYGKLASRLSAVWKGSLRSGSLIASVLEDADSDKPCVVGFGVSTFVTDEFLRHCMMPSLRWIGPELVRSLTQDESPVLGAKA